MVEIGCVSHLSYILSATLSGIGGNIEIFGLKTPFHAYVLGEHTSMKNDL